MVLICPICGEQLDNQGRSYVCPNRHSFDVARQGYVNLLPVQQKHSQNPGDTREQVLSRRSFSESFEKLISTTAAASSERFVSSFQSSSIA